MNLALYKEKEMKRYCLFMMMSVLSLMASAQDNEKQQSCYVIISYTENMDNTDFTVNIDDGIKIDYYKDENGKKAHFRTPAAALAYFESLGWELCNIGTSPSHLTYWVFKRKVSKEEYENIIKNALKK